MKQFLKQLPLSLTAFEAIWLFLLELQNVKCDMLEIKSITYITQTHLDKICL